MSKKYFKIANFDRLPVGINGSYKNKAGGRGRYLSQEAKDWKEEIGWKFPQKKELKKEDVFYVEISIYMKDKKRRDIDSGLKFILDALTGIVWQDDEQVIEVHLYKNIGSQENKTSIIVKEL